MKTHSVHVCRECGTTSPRWVGRCPGCAAWNSLDEELVGHRERVCTVDARPLLPCTPSRAITSGASLRACAELDRVLGGGLLAGSTTLLFGEPGVGKSTLALMSLRALAIAGASVLLIGAEESAAQVAQRARRLGPVPEGLEVATTTSVATALSLIEERRPHVCVIDSISAMSDDDLGERGWVGAPGAQRRRAAVRTGQDRSAPR